jgi:hypothetical protein
MKTISDKEFLDFIFSQPRENKFDMQQTTSDSDCGCLMVQYGIKHLKGDRIYAGFDLIRVDDKEFWLNKSIFHFTPDMQNCFTYGEIQDYLKEKDWVKEILGETI